MNLRDFSCISVAAVCLCTAPLARADGAQGGYSVTAGLGAVIAPRYLGSSDYFVLPIPYLDVVTPLGIYIDSGKGIGYKWLLPANFFIDTSINYASGRKDENESWLGGSNYLRGMGDIPGALITTVTAGYRLGERGAVTLAADLPLTNRSRGETYRIGFQYVIVQVGRDSLSTNAEADFGSSKYNQTFFGVDASQSANSGFPQYGVGSGLYAVRAGVTWNHQFNKNWSVSATQQVTNLTGDAANSPIVQRRASLLTDAMVTYTFK
ncbi:MAG: MipA/OmpV family protein [Paraburkholderia sp.]|jgi:outer membrane scaffolding protein for murein synthesis (MipA/OmpV family)|uniref:MipA/OmpV family protein n=1 Tax=Burkholderiaceae TaxID=119060 RepID=UPI0010F85A4B|nr:MipA/OmpV family protein [Burkholderia sp. 4M9327F10]